MKKIVNMIKRTANKVSEKFSNVAQSAGIRRSRNSRVLASTRGEGYIDSAVKIIIGVVIGGVILAGLYLLFSSTVMPTLSTKISEMFSYAG